MNKMNNNMESKIVTKSEMRKMVNEMQAPEYANCVKKEFCATCENLVFCSMLQSEILPNRSKWKPEPRQLPLFKCVTTGFKDYVFVERKLF